MSEHLPYYPPPVVLIVENDILERVSKAGTLRRQGLEVFEAADVAEAVAVLKKNRGGPSNFRHQPGRRGSAGAIG